MPSPFPGMDPYLEDPAHWEDFHHTFTVMWRGILERLLPSPYTSSISANTNFIEFEPPEIKQVEPDVAVLKSQGPTEKRSSGAVAVAEPIQRTLPMVEEVKERWIEVIQQPDDTLVAVLEVLSPWNKQPGTGRGEYLGKRWKYIHHQVHLVELDLLLGGLRLPMADGLPPGDYYALVSRTDKRPKSDVYSWMLPDRLPKIPIPLLPGDGDVIVDLAEVFSATYDFGGYARRVKYSNLSRVRIPEVHRKWVDDIANSAKPA